MSRRPPIKIRQTAAETSPESADVKRRIDSSVALQERLRSKRFDTDKPKQSSELPMAEEQETPAVAPPGELGEASSGQAGTGAGGSVQEPEQRETADTSGKAPARQQRQSPRVKADAEADGQRMSVRAIVDLETENAIVSAAAKLKQARDYVSKAMLAKARAALIARMKDKTLAAIAPEARLLLDKWQDRGTKGLETKIAVAGDDLATMRGFYNDPLGLLSDNVVVAAFVGAEMKRLIKEL